jgi:hypothetical protein
VAFAIIGVLLLLFSPLADPARLAVADQVSRLRAGQASPATFDYAYLETHGERYGVHALRQLRKDAKTPDEKAKIDAAMVMRSPDELATSPPPTASALASSITVYPKGHALPDTFLRQDWAEQKDTVYPFCLRNPQKKCDAVLVEATATTPREIILLSEPQGTNALFKEAGESWVFAGNFPYEIDCKGVREALLAGKFVLSPSSGQKLEINGLDIPVEQHVKCP